MYKLVCFVSFFRLIPHLLVLQVHPHRHTIVYDINRWLKAYHLNWPRVPGFVALMTHYPEFRNLFYHRIGHVSFFIRFLCPPVKTLFIITKNIGPGLFIQHGFATIISARSIGSDCWINQQVTIGHEGDGAPVIGNNVLIRSGAKVFGDIKIGDDVNIGANAVVFKNVPSKSTVVGVPAYIVKKNGVKVKESL